MTVHLTEQECLEIAIKWSNSRFVASAERFLVDYARELLVANEEKQAAQAQAKLDPDASYAEHLAENCTFGVAAQAQAAHPSYDKDCCHGHKDDCKCMRFDAQAAVEPAMPKLGCVNHDCDKCKAGEPVATMWREKNAKLYPGIVFDLTDTGKSLPLGVRHQLYTSPPDHTAEMESLRKANLDCVDHFNAIKADYDKAQEAMRLALEALKAQPRATRISWKDGIDIDVAMAHTKLRDAAIAALEKELT